jgi:hypothetical protein
MTEKRHLGSDRSSTSSGDPVGMPWDDCLDIVDRPAPVESPQEIFEALDGTEVWAAGREWRIEVFSVLEDSSATWLQVRLSGESEWMLTLKLRRGDTAEKALAILASWLDKPARLPEILTVG